MPLSRSARQAPNCLPADAVEQTVAWRDLVDAAPGPVLVVNRDGLITMANRHALAGLPGLILGAPYDEIALPAWLAGALADAAKGRARAKGPAEGAEAEEGADCLPDIDGLGPGLAGETRHRAERPGDGPESEDGPGDAGSPEGAQGRLNGRVVRAHRCPLPGGGDSWWLLEEGEAHTERYALRAEYERAVFLARASARLAALLNPRRCAAATAELAAEHLADAAVVITSPSHGRITLTLAVGTGTAQERTVPADPGEVPGLEEALAGLFSAPCPWSDPAKTPAWLLPEKFGPPGGLAVVPLPVSSGPDAALVLLRGRDRTGFDEDETRLARIFAVRAGGAFSVAAMYAKQADAAAVLRRGLLPPALDRTSRSAESGAREASDAVDLAGSYRAARVTGGVGGDFYDYYPSPDGAPHGTGTGNGLAVLGDVCGNDLEAAVVTGRVRHTLAAACRLTSDHLRILRTLNAALLSGQDPRFVTLVLASVRQAPHGRIALRLTSAGHPPPLIVRRTGRVEEARTHGIVLGVVADEDVEATCWETTLGPGESCLLYSDGITDARGGPTGRAFFGEQRLLPVLEECAGMPAAALVERVQMLAMAWQAGRAHDDMALLAITAPGGARPGARRRGQR